VNQDLQAVSSVIDTQEFRQAIDVLETLNSQAITRQMNALLTAFRGLETSIEQSAEVEERLRETYRLYQWLTLIAIMGEVAGVAVIYV
ncbi:MAG: hypothetical protein ABEJ66_02255, partial [Candidatus Nanohaloarchaea archaeon]